MSRRKPPKFIIHGIETHNDQIETLNHQYISSQAQPTGYGTIERTLWGRNA